MKDTIKAADQALHRIQEQAARDKVKARKARTKRLIVEGAILEKILPFTVKISPQELEAMLYEALHPSEDK